MKRIKLCPHCRGFLLPDTDGYKDYYTCLICGRQFKLDLTPVVDELTREQKTDNMGADGLL